MNNFPKTVVDRSIDIISNQSCVPESPAKRDENGDVNLCLAGVMAKAGLLISGESDRINNFEEELVKTGSKKRLEEEFTYLGWCIKLCREHIFMNDNTPSDIRKEVLLKYLTESS